MTDVLLGVTALSTLGVCIGQWLLLRELTRPPAPPRYGPYAEAVDCPHCGRAVRPDTEICPACMGVVPPF